ncbi:glycine betaine ABC transporter substrate-binding protein OsmF [Falsirhodobacter sp. 1013]|uniref:glycine betaine ABC transporter substrate-binding protein OsmF n=1 Tax=Falsirhodobacter sp. 1013 TaxID=3417566 RepID=UPI003EB7064C
MSVLKSAALALLLGTGAAQAQVVVSSKIDTEGGVLGNIILQVLQANDIPVESRLQLGGTPIVRQALLGGEIDLYPEYTGNAAFFFNRADDSVWKDAKDAWQTAHDLDLDANKVVWLAPAPANNTWGIALRDDVADEAKVGTLSDFGAWVKDGGEVKLAASSEFVNSAPALPSFQTTYGFQLSADQLVVLSGGDTAATIQAAANGTSGVNAAMVYGTDGAIPFAGLRVLADDKAVQPVYQPAPVIRAEVLEEYPQIEDALAPVFEALTLEVLQTLNGKVQVEGVPAADVAKQFLSEGGFL